MRVLCLDMYLGVDEDHFEFGSSVSLYDYDVVFWAPARTLMRYASYADTYRGKRSLRDNESARLMQDVARRRAEFKEFVEMGRSLVVIAPGDTEVYVDTGEREHSGTGRNRATTRIVKPFDLMSAVPLVIERSPGTGTEMVPANSIMAALFKQTSDCWTYRCVIGEHKSIRPLLHIKGTKKSVAGMLKAKGGGLIALLPELRLPFSNEDEFSEDDEYDDGDDNEDSDHPSGGEDQPDEDPWPGDLIVDWIESLAVEPDASLPEWTVEYQFPSELERQHKHLDLERKVADLQQLLDALSAEQAQDEKWKTLVTGTGVALERRVREALELLGFTLEEGDPGRTDLRGEHEGLSRRTVVEVKGVSKSAAERNAAQLEKWVSEELSEGRAAKGILVVNTWRELPLKNRTEEDFPHQMLAYSVQRSHCLVTGLQLLALVRTVLDHPDRRDELAGLLLDTVGVLENWSDLEAVFVPRAEPSTLGGGGEEPADGARTEDLELAEPPGEPTDEGSGRDVDS